jgi:hypothetical protein
MNEAAAIAMVRAAQRSSVMGTKKVKKAKKTKK